MPGKPGNNSGVGGVPAARATSDTAASSGAPARINSHCRRR
jgi:hypothetical protein